MKKILTYGFAVLAASAVFSSCDLDVFPHGSLSYDEDMVLFTDAKELGYLENGLYGSFRSTFHGEYAQTEELMFDSFNATADYGNNYGGIHRMDNNFNSGDSYVRDFWASRYSCIKDYNIVLKGIETLPEEYDNLREAAELVKGEALFFRAFAYMDLIRHYAKQYNPSSASSDLGVPLVLEYKQAEKPSRATVKEVYDQIKADLDGASAALSGVAGAVRSGKVTIDAVNALYARYFLDVQDYTNAYAYATRVINSAAGYALSSSVEEFTKEYYTDEGSEPIMQLYASQTENGSGTNDFYTYMASDSEHGRYFNSPYYLPSQKLLNLYSEDDLRLQCWFTKGANAFTGETYYVRLVGGFFQNEFYVFTKYLGNPGLTSSNVLNARQHVKPIMIGEMYLIAAEAAFRGGNTGDAQAMLNTLQTTRGGTSTTISEDSVYNEWLKEKVGEGLRLSVMKRFGKGYSGRAAQPRALALTVMMTGSDYETKNVDASDYHYLWPIPSNEIQTNPNIANQQNPGY